jgi:hypothetical protein
LHHSSPATAGQSLVPYRKIVKLPNEQKVRISGTPTLNTKLAAEAAERDHISRVVSPPAAIEEEKEVPTFQKFVEVVWWPTYSSSVNNRPSTCQEKEIHLRIHLKPTLGPLPLDKIRGEVVTRLMAKLKDESKLCPKSIKNIIGTLRRVLASAVEWEYLSAMPPLPRIKVAHPGDFLTPEEAEKVLEAARARSEEVYASILFALHTGARAGQEITLEWATWTSTAGCWSSAAALPRAPSGRPRAARSDGHSWRRRTLPFRRSSSGWDTPPSP